MPTPGPADAAEIPYLDLRNRFERYVRDIPENAFPTILETFLYECTEDLQAQAGDGRLEDAA